MDTMLTGVIGGSGLYKMKELKILEERDVETPFGSPSDKVVIGELNGVRLAFYRDMAWAIASRRRISIFAPTSTR